MKLLISLAALVAPTAAYAANQVSLQSTVFVERNVAGSDGKMHIVQAAPKPVFPGDHLLFQLNYHNLGEKPAVGFTVTNPIPASVGFLSSDSGAQYSVDGGKSWGPLAALRVKGTDGSSRAAGPDDITHVRWTFQKAIPAGGVGSVSFRGIVK